MKKILLLGTFDGLHSGHYNLIQNASNEGRVFVLVTSDELNINNPAKGELIFNEDERVNEIKRLNIVEEADILTAEDKFLEKYILSKGITDIAYGSDYKDNDNMKSFATMMNIGYMVFDRTSGISSTELRKKWKN